MITSFPRISRKRRRKFRKEKSKVSTALSNVSSTLGGKARAAKRVESVSTMPGVHQILGWVRKGTLRNAIFLGCTLCFPSFPRWTFSSRPITKIPRPRSILRSRNGHILARSISMIYRPVLALNKFYPTPLFITRIREREEQLNEERFTTWTIAHSTLVL